MKTTRLEHIQRQDEAILDVLRALEVENGDGYEAGTREVAQRTPWSVLTVQRRLDVMFGDGLVSRSVVRPDRVSGTHSRHWRVLVAHEDAD